MIIDRIRFANHNGTQNIDINIGGATPGDLYICKSVDGLGSPDIVLTQTNSLDVDSKISNVVFHNRQLIFTLDLNPDFKTVMTPDELRVPFYNLILARGQRPLRIWFQMVGDSGFNYYVDGGISKIVPNHFSKGPQIQVTVDCTAPFISGLETHLAVSQTGWDATIDYPGTAPAGFEIAVDFTENSSFYTLTMDREAFYGPNDDVNSISPGLTINYPFLAGDHLMINSIPGQKDVFMLRGGIESFHLLSSVDGTDANWPILIHGLNKFSSLSNGGNNISDVKLIPKYMGV